MTRLKAFFPLLLVLLLILQTSDAYEVTLGLLMPRSLTKIAEFAIDQVNQDVFKDVNIKAGMRWEEFTCDEITPIGIASRFHYIHNSKVRRVDAYIGPVDKNDSCSKDSCQSASDLSASLGKAMLSPACQSVKRNRKRKEDDVFVRTSYLPIDFSNGNEAVTCDSLPDSVLHFNKLMDLFKWKYITVIVPTKYFESAKYLRDSLQKCAKDIATTTDKIIEIRKYNSTVFSDPNSTRDFNNVIQEFLTHKESRIFFLHGTDEDNARILVKAHENKMFNGTWGFITTEFNRGKIEQWKNAEWMKRKDGNGKMWKFNEVFSGFIDFSNPSVDIKKFEKEYKKKVTERDAYLYDAIKLYAVAYKKAYLEYPPHNITISVLMEKMLNTTFEGASGNVEITKQKDRGFKSYEIKYYTNGMIEEKCTATKFKELGDKSIVKCDDFTWPGGEIPLDIPECGFNGEHCKQMKILTIVFIVIAFILISLTIAAFVLYKRNKYGNNDLVSKGFVVDAEVILKMQNTKKETESNPSFEHNGKAGGSIKGSICSRSPMLVEQGDENQVGKKANMAEKISMKDAISIGSNTDSIRERNNNVFKHKGQIVVLKQLQRSSVNISRDKDIKDEFKNVRDIHDQNLCAVIGVCLQSPHVSIIEQYCSKGSLDDVLQDDTVDLDMMFKMSFSSDIAHGMTELHRHGIIHGRLKSSNCVIDNRWVCKITDYGMHKFREEHYTNRNQREDITEQEKTKGKLWRAPELLQDNSPGKKPTKESDVYSFGIILSEIVTREDPYSNYNMQIKDIVDQVKASKEPPFRPHVPDPLPNESDELQLLVKEMRKCWDQAPNRRPNFDALRTTLKPKGSMMDNMIMRLEKYTNDLEDKVTERNEELKGEKAKNDELLYKMLPMPVAIALQNGKEIPPISFDCVTIFFSDIVGFTSLASESTPMQVVALLNDLYSMFDQCTDSYDCYKVETIGDAYMVVSGLPDLNGDKHAGQIATLSLDLLHHIKSFRIRHKPDTLLQLRIGIHSGPCVAGVVGLKMPRYCLFGDTVNYASRMESSGLALRVHVSPECKEVLDKLALEKPPEIYHLQDRGLVHMKGKGEIHTYFLTGREGFTKSLPDLSMAAGLDAHDFK